MSGTAFNGDYNFIPKSALFSEYDSDRLQKFMDQQAELVEEMGDDAPEAFLILDDVLGVANFADKVFTRLMSCYRHYRISVFLASQYIYKIPPLIRECAKYVFIFKQTTKRSFEALYETYGYLFEKLDDFKEEIIKKTENYNVLMYDLDAPNVKNKKFVQVKAQKTPKFRLEF